MTAPQAPSFWLDQTTFPNRLKATLLRPLGWIWLAVTRMRRAFATPYRATVPVICIGNVAAGGSGKTPMAVTLATALQDSGMALRPVIVTRGYGGADPSARLIDLARETAASCGDEALLLARHVPTIVAANRVAGIRLAEDGGFDVILTDDGFQNPHFAKTASLLVFDGAVGIGNGLCIPAGPCRETLTDAVPRAAAAIIVGEDKTALRDKLRVLPVFSAHFKAAYNPAGGHFVAFAGIGRPQKFFETLRENGYAPLETVSFSDHHVFTAADLDGLAQLAALHQARLITTEKDHVRLPENFRAHVEVLPVTLKVDGMAELLTLLRTRAGAI